MPAAVRRRADREHDALRPGWRDDLVELVTRVTH
jgi:hypothetical protein